VKEP